MDVVEVDQGGVQGQGDVEQEDLNQAGSGVGGVVLGTGARVLDPASALCISLSDMRRVASRKAMQM